MARKAVSALCSNCEKVTILESVTKKQVIVVRKEPIEVDIQMRRCAGCGDEVFDPEGAPDPLNLAYREYRQRHGMLQPEEIRNWRRSLRLTQAELANLVGLGGATVQRYENGSLQDTSHDTLLKLAMDPPTLFRFVERSQGILPEAKRERLLQSLGAEQANCTLETTVASMGNDKADEYNGYRKLDMQKLYNAVLFFCREEGVVKTKLNKLLFYADFRHFKKTTLSITGAKYAHIPFGPAPHNYELYYAVMASLGLIGFREVEYPGGMMGELIEGRQDPDLNVFDSEELLALASVKANFQTWSASEITRYSHQEQGYEETQDGKLISYEYACNLERRGELQ